MPCPKEGPVGSSPSPPLSSTLTRFLGDPDWSSLLGWALEPSDVSVTSSPFPHSCQLIPPTSFVSTSMSLPQRRFLTCPNLSYVSSLHISKPPYFSFIACNTFYNDIWGHIYPSNITLFCKFHEVKDSSLLRFTFKDSNDLEWHHDAFCDEKKLPWYQI